MKLSRTVVSIAAVAALVAIPGAAFADSHVAGDDQCSEGEAPDYGGVCPDDDVDDDDMKPTPKPTTAPTQKVIRTLQTR